jgi:hypothetical protein
MDEPSGRRTGFKGTLAAACGLAALVAAPARAVSMPSEIDFAICPTVTQTTYTAGGVGPGQFGCGSVVLSPGFISFQPDNGCTTPTNTDLGTFLTTQNPLGSFVHVSAPPNCATNPPMRGPGAGQGSALTLSVTQTGFCPTTLTIQARTGPYGAVVFPIGSLPLGSYRVTVAFPDQMSWLGSQASGMLHVGTSFTETDTSALVSPGKNDTFAVLIRNSVAGPGAGELVSTKTTNPSVATLSGTDYFACGTIRIAATVTYGKPARKGVVHLSGNGSITGGTGNYVGLKGTFTVTGTYSRKTNRGTLVFTGTGTY